LCAHRCVPNAIQNFRISRLLLNAETLEARHGPEPEPPEHLSDDVKAFWRTVVSDFDLEPWHIRLLQCAVESWDRMQEARRTLAAEGSTYRNRFGAPVKHPSIGIEQDARMSFLRSMRELALDASVTPESRPHGGAKCHDDVEETSAPTMD
jgi:P27 family predicted phage terminase small subunit